MNNQTTDNVEELEVIERNALVAKYEALQSLKEDKRFQVLITDGYFKEEAIRLTSMLGTEYTRQAGVRGVLMENLVAISTLEDHFATIEALGAPVEDEEE